MNSAPINTSSTVHFHRKKVQKPAVLRSSVYREQYPNSIFSVPKSIRYACWYVRSYGGVPGSLSDLFLNNNSWTSHLLSYITVQWSLYLRWQSVVTTTEENGTLPRKSQMGVMMKSTVKYTDLSSRKKWKSTFRAHSTWDLFVEEVSCDSAIVVWTALSVFFGWSFFVFLICHRKINRLFFWKFAIIILFQWFVNFTA